MKEKPKPSQNQNKILAYRCAKRISREDENEHLTLEDVITVMKAVHGEGWVAALANREREYQRQEAKKPDNKPEKRKSIDPKELKRDNRQRKQQERF